MRKMIFFIFFFYNIYFNSFIINIIVFIYFSFNFFIITIITYKLLEIGLNHLYAIHLNDSMNPFEAHKDRHAKINEGHIGFDTLLKVVTHPKLKHLPFILETPNELPGYAQEIAMFRNAVEHC